MLHSVFSNGLMLPPRFHAILRAHAAPKAWFIGNEYKLMPEKMAFAEELDVTLLVSQSANPQLHALYRERLGCEVAWLPGGGLDPELITPDVAHELRPIDVGYRAYPEPLYCGHQDRRRIAGFFLEHGANYSLRTDISLDPEKRLAGVDWAAFLSSCKGQLASEGGTDYFELTDDTRLRVIAYLDEHPDASLEDLEALFEQSAHPRVSGRILTGRNVEAAGAKTVQILFDGHYNGLLEPDVHYIPLRKDLSNAEDVVAKFRDERVVSEIVEAAYELAQTQLTYPRLVDAFLDDLAPAVER